MSSVLSKKTDTGKEDIEMIDDPSSLELQKQKSVSKVDRYVPAW